MEFAGGEDQSDDNKSASDEMDAEDEASGNTPVTEASADSNDSKGESEEEEEESESDQDPAELMSQLTDLVKRMMPIIAADPAQQDALRGIAQQAQAALKDGDHSNASDHIFSLRDFMDGWESNSGQANGAAGDSQGQGQEVEEDADADHQAHAAAQAPTITKARTAWMATRQKIDGDMGKLHKAFSSAFEGHEKGDQIYGAFQTRVTTVLDTLSHELADMLDAVNKARTRTERQQMVEQAHKLLEQYQAHVAADQTIAALDKNPFMPLQVQKTMLATLAALSRTIT